MPPDAGATTAHTALATETPYALCSKPYALFNSATTAHIESMFVDADVVAMFGDGIVHI